MLRIEKSTGSLIRLPDSSTQDSGLLERYDIQKMIRNYAPDFFKELGEALLLIGEEVQPAEFVKDRIDLLALDTEGTAVVIELKRGGDNKLQLMQGISYAGMVAEWSPDRILQQFASFVNKPLESARDELEQFLDEGLGTLNQSQRIVLLADQFPYEVLIGSKWLHEKDVRCYRFVLASGESGQVFLTCPRVYPPLELTETASKPAVSGLTTGYSTWDEALENGVENPAVKQFFQQELANGVENTLAGGWLYYRVGNRRMFSVGPRRPHAYVWQYDRFDDDVAFWRSLLGESAEVRIVDHGRSLRFLLKTEEQFVKFKNALNQDLVNKHFIDAGEDEAPPEPPT